MPRSIPPTPTPPVTPTATPTVAEVAELIHTVAHRVRHEARDELEPLGVTWAQVRALRAVAHCPDGVRMSGLADELRIARRSATSVVDELEARGLVERSADPDDRRAVGVRLTPAGAALLREVSTRRRDAAGRVLGTLSQEELRAVRDALARALARPDGSGSAPSRSRGRRPARPG